MYRIEHVSIWVKDLEKIRQFYTRYFNTVSNKKYVNASKGFSSYFLTFRSGSRIEIMSRSNIHDVEDINKEYYGYCHIAISVGSKERVVELTEMIRNDGYKIASEPRETGDGYFESVVLDPEENRIEIAI